MSESDQAPEARTAEEPKTGARRSERYRKEALRLYDLILDRYPAYERRDEVLFVAAHNLYDSGQKEQGVERYQALIQRGEHFFARNDLPRARAAFERVAAFHVPKLYAFAVYKLAWCDYHAGAYTRAIARFQEVIAYAEGETRGDRVQLKAEALRDIVLAYARVDAVETAVAYLADKGGEGSIDAIERLGSTYFDDGKFDQAIRVYPTLQQRAKGHVRA